MNPQDPYQTPPTQPVPTPTPIKNPLAVMQAGEQVICEIKRHPIGILSVYGFSGVLLIVVLVMVILAPHIVAASNRNEVTSIGIAVYGLFALLCLGFVFIANKVYWGNRWVVTTDSVTQVTQNSLFDKQSSQLSLGNLEDVTAEQHGILAHMFNYGVLKVETAGERSKFVFIYCPNPSFYAQQILNGREQFEQGRRDANPQPLYRDQASYAQPVAGPPPTAANPPTQPPQPQDPYVQPAAPPTYQYPPASEDHGVNSNTQ